MSLPLFVKQFSSSDLFNIIKGGKDIHLAEKDVTQNMVVESHIKAFDWDLVSLVS